MKPLWQACFWLLLVVGGGAFVASVLELLGVFAKGELLGEEATDPGRIGAVIAGVLILPYAITGLLHARLAIDDERMTFLGHGLWCRTRRVELRHIKRHGWVINKRQGRRELMLLLELDDLTRQSVKLEMYKGGRRFLEQLEARVGPATPVEVGVWGARFEEPQ